jgi:RecB family exonuclease
MVPVEVRQQPHVSFTQIDQYLRCPLRYRFLYIDRLEPDFVPAARAFGSGIHAAAAMFFRGVGQGERPRVEDVQGYFESFWNLETEHQPLRYGEKESKESLLDLARRMLAVLCAGFQQPGTEVVAVEQPFAVPLIDQETGEILDRDLVGTLDLLERDAEGLVVVDLKTSTRKYTDLQVETALQLSVYSYAVGLSTFANGDDVRLRFDVLTKTKQPELHRYWTTRDRAGNVRLFRLVSEVLGAIEAGAFHPIVGWQCKGCVFRSKCWAWQ